MITPIIISGGSGTRLWPLSRKLQPKQFISLGNDTTLFQDTILRLPKEAEDPIIICNEDHRFLAAEQLREINKLSAGIIIAQVSDAGTPGISDPGFLLIRESIRHNIRVECLPGATAFVPALVKSGLPCEKFVFEGFLPHKKGRQTRLKELANETRTIVFYESPYRLVKTLKQFAEFIDPERQVSVSRELTKIYEETKNGTVTEVADYFEQKRVKGEIVIILKGAE